MGYFVCFIEFLYKFSLAHELSIPPPFSFTSFFTFTFHINCFSSAYDESTLFLPSYCFHAPSSGAESAIVYILINP